MGGPGGEASWRGGRGGCPPINSKEGGESPALATSPRVGPKTLANPKQTRVGETLEIYPQGR